MKEFRIREIGRAARLTIFFFLALTSALLAAQPAGQDQPGRAGATLEAANAPAVAARRAKLMEAHKDAVIIIPSQFKARDGMRDNLNFLYLTGLQEPEAVLVLDPAGSPRETIFRQRAGGPGGPGAMGMAAAEMGSAAPSAQSQPPSADKAFIEKPVASSPPLSA